MMKNKMSLLVLLAWNLPSLAAADSTAASSVVLVDIDGAKVSLADVEAKQPGALFQPRNAFYQAERKVLDAYIDDYLLERQAQREHLSVEKLLDKHVNGAAGKEPSEEALRVYYEGLDTTQPFEALRGQILDQIRDNRIAKAKAAYVKSLRAASAIKLALDAPRAPISLKDTPIRGVPDASVMIIEYADYECPYCQKLAPTLDQLQAAYGAKVALAYKDMPLPMHSHSEKAAEAAHCAGAQGKFWEYHDLLFSRKELEVPELKEQARTLKLDAQKFDHCLDSGEQAALVSSQSTEGQGFQLQGTPSFFINGRFFPGVLSYEQLRTVIDEELAGAAGRNASRAQVN